MVDTTGDSEINEISEDGLARRRAVKIAAGAAVAGAAWAAPTLNGVSLVPTMAGASTVPPIATPCMSFDTTGTWGSNCFDDTQVRTQPFGPATSQGWVALTVQGCTVPGDTATTRLADFPGEAHDFETPAGYVCRFELSGDCGVATVPVASSMPLGWGLAGLIISNKPDCPGGLGPAANNNRDICWVVKCDPV